MLSTICLSGSLEEKIDERFRYLEIERTPVRDTKPVIDRIPVAFWNPQPNSRLHRLNKGTLVLISGRLERDEVIGLYILCERLEYISKMTDGEKIVVL